MTAKNIASSFDRLDHRSFGPPEAQGRRHWRHQAPRYSLGKLRRLARSAMIRRRSTILVAVFLACVPVAPGQRVAHDWAERLVRNVRSSSFPELARKDIRVDPFTSDSDYFQARFSIPRFLLGRRMCYSIRVNSGAPLFTASEEARRAIVAHELAHIAYYANGNRLHLLGLLRLAGKGFRQRFEKCADVEALRRGYAQGLKQYRIWLYEYVPPGALMEKKRDYLSPDEIDALERSTRK